ncbi:MBL fold metallo-hydrolase [Candidatus Woesearchaeota archaeon]|nr:MBL fold metallo-hydrolase [Candidatus Woesearchaeota archaeon]
MEPKIIFLGTAGDAIVVGKQLRASGGIIIQVDNTQLHIDPGPGALTMASMYGINLRNTNAILVSDNHINHCNDINAVINAMTAGGEEPKGVLICCKSVVERIEDQKELTPFLMPHYKQLLDKTIILERGNKTNVNEIDIKATYTKHSDHAAVGFRILSSKFNLGYTGDTGFSKKLIDDFNDIDMLILNVQNPASYKKDHQLNSDDAIKIILDVKPKLAVITHFGIKMLEADVLSEVRRIHLATGIQVIAAKDGMSINPVSYSVQLRQKTLNLFK